MDKFTKYGWWVLIIITLVLGFWIYAKQENQSIQSKYPTKEFTETKTRNYEAEFYCEDTSNVGRTECLIEKLDRASAIREWKQRKIEMLKHPEVNMYNLITFLPDEVAKMKKWREDFENSRDEGCDVEWSFRGGSGVPGAIAECELNYEISALKILDKVYYGTILKDTFDSKGIPDFEPKEKDIEKLMESNKTERGCVWADDPACE